jgi:hypothetical protein
MDGASFMYTRKNDVFIVAASRKNTNPTMVFQFIYRMIDVFRAYFGGDFTEDAIRENYPVIYELLDGKFLSSLTDSPSPLVPLYMSPSSLSLTSSICLYLSVSLSQSYQNPWIMDTHN